MTSVPREYARDNAGVKFPPPLLFAVLLLFGFAIERLSPLEITSRQWLPALHALGWAMIIGSIALFLVSLMGFRKAKTSIIPVKPSTTLVFAGPYRFTRNPMYLGFLVLSAGIALAANALWPLLMLPFMVVFTNALIIAKEERYLERKFGEEYLGYKRRVRRWL